MNYFNTCKTLDEAKTLYKNLMKENHPDVGGDTETAKAINAAYDEFCIRFMSDSFTSYTNDTGKTAYADVNVFAATLAKVMKMNVTIEVIGYWIYVRDCWEVETKEALGKNGLGFFYSSKHKSYIYNGGIKKRIHTNLTTNDVRGIHGSEVVKTREEYTQIGA